jgi:hypothetical protein
MTCGHIQPTVSKAGAPAWLLRDAPLWVGFLLIAALSFVSPIAAVALLAAACLLAMAKWPNSALGVATFVLGFKQIFGLDPSQTRLLMLVALGGVATQALCDRRSWTIAQHLQRYPLLALLAISLLLDAAHVASAPSQESALRLGWHLLTTLAALRTAALADDVEAMRSLKYSLIAAGILIALISMIYLYVPWPALVGDIFVHTEILRLVGVQDDANSIARWFLPAAIAALMAHDRHQSAWTFLFVVAAAIVLYATASKSGLIWFGFAWLLTVFFSGRWRAAGTAVLAMAVGAALWFGAIEHPLKRYAATWWYEAKISNDGAVAVAYDLYTKPNSIYEHLSKYAPKALFGNFLMSLRVNTSSVPLAVDPKMQAANTSGWRTFKAARDWSHIHDARIKVIPGSDYSLAIFESGNRRRLWTIGFNVFRSHFWWGIGAEGWPDEMIHHLGFPYVSPHDGFLHVAGSYGLLGALLYIAALWRIGWLVLARQGDQWALFTVACYFGFELFDVSCVFTPTIIGAVICMLIGRVEGAMCSQMKSISDQDMKRATGTMIGEAGSAHEGIG